MPHDVALSLQSIGVRYGTRIAVADLTLQVRRGEIVGLLGPNGSGKSSTLLVAAGVLDPAQGTVAIEGISHREHPAAYAHKVGLVPQGDALFEELTAVENLRYFGRLYGLSHADLQARITRALARARLTDRAHARVGTFSGGMKQRLNIAVALLHDPVVLLLDEPTAALDPASREALFADLQQLRDDGHAILLTTHHLDEAEEGCDRVAILQQGKLIAQGTPQDLREERHGQALTIYGHLNGPLPKYLERCIRQKLPATVEMELVGRRMRLQGTDREALGRALAVILSEGVPLDNFRSLNGGLTALTHKVA